MLFFSDYGCFYINIPAVFLSVSDFLFFWGIVFMVSTTLVAFLKSENSRNQRSRRRPKEETQGVMETYKLLFSIIKLPAVFTFCCLLLTSKVDLASFIEAVICLVLLLKTGMKLLTLLVIIK